VIKNIKILLLVTFFIIHNSYSFAENKISFIDVNFIFMNSNAGKKVNDQIKNKREKINKEFLSYKKTIDDEQKKLSNQQNILSEDELRKKAIDLEKKAKEYNAIISKKNDELNNYKNKATKEFYIILTKIMQDYAVSNSVEMILKKENILIGKNNLDITKEIMNLFNKNIKDIKIK
tara:strand:- start:448 stop:975 length:528 start_codon:yes stop_codon:yes gene_type:complete